SPRASTCPTAWRSRILDVQLRPANAGLSLERAAGRIHRVRRPATYCSSVVVLLAVEPQQVRFRPAGEVLDPDHHDTECGRGGELCRIDRQRHRGAGARPYHGERTGADRIVERVEPAGVCRDAPVRVLTEE